MKKFFKNILGAFWQTIVVLWRDGLWSLLQWGWKNKVKFAIILLTTLFTLVVMIREFGRGLDAGRVMEERAKNSEIENLRKERDELRSKVAMPAATPAPISNPSPATVVVKKATPDDIDRIRLKTKTSTLPEVPVGAKVIRSVPKVGRTNVSDSGVTIRVPDENSHWFKESGTFLDVKTGERFVAPPEILCRDSRAHMVFRPFATLMRVNPVLAGKVLGSCPKRPDRVVD